MGTNTAVLGRSFGYTYDPIGNRVTSSLDGATSTYTPNSLNQYTQRTVPGQVVTTGLAPANAAVDVNSSATTRQGEYYYKALFVTNTTSAAWTTLTTVSNLGGTDTRSSFVPQTPEAYTYDNDGNITSDGRWTYEWDAENRLTAMETRSAAYTVGTPRQRLEFKYDYLGRRVQKRVLNWSAPGWSLVSERRFIYDGWNLMAQFETSSGYVLKGRYVWGIDLSGNLQDAGGVGGLLSVYSAELNVEASPAFDGNGNVYGLIDRTSGVLRATYEYSPYGETLRSAGEFADKNPFRFSTKFTDNETQMVYYGFRYYSPSLGRFYGRDPMEEKGGLHLYAFVENQVLNKWDLLGKLSNGKPKQSIVGAVFSWIGRTLGTVFGGRSIVSQSHSPAQVVNNNSRVTGPFAEETVQMNVFNVNDKPMEDSKLSDSTQGLYSKGIEFLGSGIRDGFSIDGRGRPQDEKKENPGESDAERIKNCQGIAKLMGEIGNKFASTTFGDSGMPNPMSASEFFDKVAYNAGAEAAGLVNAILTPAGGGSLLQTVSFAAGTESAKGIAEQSPFMAALNSGLYTASAAQFANDVSVSIGGRQLLSQRGGAFVKNAGWVGAGVTAISIVGSPLLEYAARNRAPTQPNGVRRLHE